MDNELSRLARILEGWTSEPGTSSVLCHARPCVPRISPVMVEQMYCLQMLAADRE